jgi:hypothetical protein
MKKICWHGTPLLTIFSNSLKVKGYNNISYYIFLMKRVNGEGTATNSTNVTYRRCKKGQSDSVEIRDLGDRDQTCTNSKSYLSFSHL